MFGGDARARASLYRNVQCIMGNGHMGPPPVARQTHTSKNVTFLQL